jgi:HD-GYP domain-containing protein (c-di-GMP phosphodiesterase class II)
MRQHSVIGERILSAAPSLAQVAKLVRATHERFDGTGYPDALAGDQIPIGARIIAACDALEAMTADRAYRQRVTQRDAIGELERCAGTQFDPAVVAPLVQLLGAPSSNGLVHARALPTPAA